MNAQPQASLEASSPAPSISRSTPKYPSRGSCSPQRRGVISHGSRDSTGGGDVQRRETAGRQSQGFLVAPYSIRNGSAVASQPVPQRELGAGFLTLPSSQQQGPPSHRTRTTHQAGLQSQGVDASDQHPAGTRGQGGRLSTHHTGTGSIHRSPWQGGEDYRYGNGMMERGARSKNHSEVARYYPGMTGQDTRSSGR